MILSHDRRYIFVHIPKTGGTALTQALEARATASDLLIGDTPKALRRRKRVAALAETGQARGRLWKHATLADLEGLVAREEFARYFVFTLVRNPWDRIVSYYHWLQAQNWDHAAVRRAKSSDFSGFLNAQDMRRGLSVPYGAYLRDGAGRDRGTLYARLEHLEADLAPLWTHLGFDLSPIARANASERARDYRSYYSAEDAALVGRLAAEDIARFGYRFDPDG